MLKLSTLKGTLNMLNNKEFVLNETHIVFISYRHKDS